MPSSVAAAAQAEILVGDEEAVVGVAQQRQAAAGRFVHPVLVQQQAETGVGAAADPSAQLVELGQTEAFGVLDHHHRGFRDIDADLHDRGGDQQPDRAGGKRGQGRVADLRRLLPVREADPVAEPLLQVDEPLLRGGDVQSLALGDQRADPIDLGAFVQFAGDAVAAPSAWCRGSAGWCGSAARPAGFSVSRLTSISPHWVSSSVRGIGVAVITSTSVRSPLAPSVSRWLTPKRCCSSITASARSRYSTASWNSAWVPTTIWMRAVLDAAQQRGRAPCP